MCTRARRAVLTMLDTVRSHVSAGQVYDLIVGQGSEVNLTTVHRMFGVLSAAGVVHTGQVDGSPPTGWPIVRIITRCVSTVDK